MMRSKDATPIFKIFYAVDLAYPRRDSNPHLPDFEAGASTKLSDVGLNNYKVCYYAKGTVLLFPVGYYKPCLYESAKGPLRLPLLR